MFQGAAALNLDAKGRMAVPARHRDALQALGDGRLVLTAHPHRCLLLYPAPAWEPIRAKILAAPSLETQSAMLRRLLVGFAVEAEMDMDYRAAVVMMEEVLAPGCRPRQDPPVNESGVTETALRTRHRHRGSGEAALVQPGQPVQGMALGHSL